MQCSHGGVHIENDDNMLVGTNCHSGVVPIGMYTTAQARAMSVDCVKLDEVALQGSGKGSRQDAITLDPADLGAPDLILVGNSWTIPVHRYARIRCTLRPCRPCLFMLMCSFQGLLTA